VADTPAAPKRRARAKAEAGSREETGKPKRSPGRTKASEKPARAADAKPAPQPAEVEAESPAPMPQAAPMPPAAVMPGAAALADVMPGRVAAAAGMPGLGALTLPQPSPDAAGDMLQGVMAAANVGLAANAEMMRAISSARSPWDIFYAQARATQTVSEAWMREAARLPGLYFGFFSERR
jgi:hypothetical protein